MDESQLQEQKQKFEQEMEQKYDEVHSEVVEWQPDAKITHIAKVYQQPVEDKKIEKKGYVKKQRPGILKIWQV